jgi:hypothetical protein
VAIDSVPECVQHGVSAADGTIAPYEKCSAFFTYASNQTFKETDNSVWIGASNGTILLVALGFIVCIAALIAWVKTEDMRLSAQDARLRAGRPQRPAGPASPAAGVAPDRP